MAEVHNLTPFSCLVHPQVDQESRQHGRLVVVKGVWHLNTNQLADQPGLMALRSSPLTVRIGELGLDAVQEHVMAHDLQEVIDWLPSDLGPPKPKFDLLVCGHAYTEGGRPRHQFVAGIAHANHQVGLVLRAPRFWRKTLLQGNRGVPGEPLGEIVRVPVHPRFSFGGVSSGADELYNPQGMGSPAVALASPASSQDLNRTALPWVEHPDHPVTHVAHSPLPASFGIWGENTGSRAPYYGTRDAAWQRLRAPRLPLDFNPLFHNQAEPRLQWPQPPRPGEPIEFHRLTSDGYARLSWPTMRPQLLVDHQAVPSMVPDTCIVAPDAGLFAVVWRCFVKSRGQITLRVARV